MLSSFVGATFCFGHVARSILQGGVAKKEGGHMAGSGSGSSGKSAKNDPGIPLAELRPGQLALMPVVNSIHKFLVLRLKL